MPRFKTPVDAVTLEMIESTVRSIIGNGRSDGRYQQNRCLEVLRAAFSIALAHDQIARLPTDGLKRNREQRVENLLTQDELARIGQALLDLEAEGRVGISQIELIRGLLLTGARFRELATLEWTDIDFDAAEARPRFFKGKTQSSTSRAKVIHLSPPAVELLQRMHYRKQCQFVFPSRSRDGKRWVPTDTVWVSWQKVLKRAGIKNRVRLHDSRHNYASTLLREGVDLATVSKLLGHKDLKSTMRYVHSDHESERDAAKIAGKTIGHALAPK